MGVNHRLAKLERRKRKAERGCDDCGGHGVPVITYDGVVDRAGCPGCGRSYVLLAFVAWGGKDNGPTTTAPASPR